jgi:hypothetical protein
VRQHAPVSPTTGRLGTVVVRAWVEPGRDVADVRARVLFVGGRAEEMTEVGVAAGLDDVVSLVVEALSAMSD